MRNTKLHSIALAILCAVILFISAADTSYASRASHHSNRNSANKYKLTNFTLVLGHWPKCAGEAISVSDFNVTTDPSSAAKYVKLSYPDGTTNGTSSTVEHEAKATLGGKSIPCKYEVLSSSGKDCDPLVPIVTNISISTYLKHDTYTFDWTPPAGEVYEEIFFVGTVSGTSQYAMVGTTPVSGCGSSLEVETEHSCSTKLSVGTEWPVISADVGLSFTTTDTITLTHEAEANKTLQAIAWKHSLTLKVHGMSDRHRKYWVMNNSVVAVTDWDTTPMAVDFDEIGGLDPKQQICRTCCSLH